MVAKTLEINEVKSIGDETAAASGDVPYSVEAWVYLPNEQDNGKDKGLPLEENKFHVVARDLIAKYEVNKSRVGSLNEDSDVTHVEMVKESIAPAVELEGKNEGEIVNKSTKIEIEGERTGEEESQPIDEEFQNDEIKTEPTAEVDTEKKMEGEDPNEKVNIEIVGEEKRIAQAVDEEVHASNEIKRTIYEIATEIDKEIEDIEIAFDAVEVKEEHRILAEEEEKTAQAVDDEGQPSNATEIATINNMEIETVNEVIEIEIEGEVEKKIKEVKTERMNLAAGEGQSCNDNEIPTPQIDTAMKEGEDESNEKVDPEIVREEEETTQALDMEVQAINEIVETIPVIENTAEGDTEHIDEGMKKVEKEATFHYKNVEIKVEGEQATEPIDGEEHAYDEGSKTDFGGEKVKETSIEKVKGKGEGQEKGITECANESQQASNEKVTTVEIILEEVEEEGASNKHAKIKGEGAQIAEPTNDEGYPHNGRIKSTSNVDLQKEKEEDSARVEIEIDGKKDMDTHPFDKEIQTYNAAINTTLKMDFLKDRKKTMSIAKIEVERKIASIEVE